ncbi:hypothetical protein VTO73DRAFT_5345 [Trametes versicolor]
MQTWAR